MALTDTAGDRSFLCVGTKCTVECTLTKYFTTSDNSSDLAKPVVTHIFICSFRAAVSSVSMFSTSPACLKRLLTL